MNCCPTYAAPPALAHQDESIVRSLQQRVEALELSNQKMERLSNKRDSEPTPAPEPPQHSTATIPPAQCAIFYKSHGPMKDVAHFIEDAPVPPLSPGHVLIKVHAASFNPVDSAIAGGYLKERGAYFQPNRAVGSDVCGTVVSVGDGATVISFDVASGVASARPAEVGDVVFGDGILGTGTFAQYAMINAKQLVLRPATLSDVDAAALPLAGLTAYQCMSKYKKVEAGMKVLVLGGSGGVGSFAVQVAKALGASVAATSTNTELVKSLGADIVINYRETDWGEALKGEGYDLIFATTNDDKPSPAWERAQGVLKPDGAYVCLLGGPKEVPPTGPSYKFMLTDSMATSDLCALIKMHADGKLKSVLHEGAAFTFGRDGGIALGGVAASGRAKGKLVMRMI
jgi:NADPH:quinone reductase-like Zn-dependent oxidoreductase